MLKDQSYGYINAQPSLRGMTNVIVNTVWDDIERLQHKLVIVAALVDDPTITDPGEVVSRIGKITDGGGQP